LRREGAAALGRRDGGPAPREHAAWGGTRCHLGATSSGCCRTSPQTSRAPHCRQGLQLPELSTVVAGTRDQAHHPREARPAGASYEASRKAAEFQHHDLREAQRSRKMRKQTQAVARDSHALREAGRELPGSGCNRCTDDLVGLVNRQMHPSPLRRAPRVGRLRLRGSERTRDDYILSRFGPRISSRAGTP
jgi:hypothetical protein